MSIHLLAMHSLLSVTYDETFQEDRASTVPSAELILSEGHGFSHAKGQSKMQALAAEGKSHSDE